MRENMEIKRPDYYKLIVDLFIKDLIDISNCSYHLGTAIAYLYRAGKKEGNTFSSDVTKAITQLEFEISRITLYSIPFISTSHVKNIVPMFHLNEKLLSTSIDISSILLNIFDFLSRPNQEEIDSDQYLNFLDETIAKLTDLISDID